MTEKALCIYHEEGWLFGLALVVIMLIGLIAVVLFVYILKSHNDGIIEIWKDKLRASGRAVSLVVSFFLIAGIVYLLYSIYTKYGEAHTVALDTGSGSVSLEKVWQEFQGQTKVKVYLSEKVGNFQIKGEFRGSCVSDLLRSICAQYREIECKRSYWPSEVTLRWRETL